MYNNMSAVSSTGDIDWVFLTNCYKYSPVLLKVMFPNLGLNLYRMTSADKDRLRLDINLVVAVVYVVVNTY